MLNQIDDLINKDITKIPNQPINEIYDQRKLNLEPIDENFEPNNLNDSGSGIINSVQGNFISENSNTIPNQIIKSSFNPPENINNNVQKNLIYKQNNNNDDQNQFDQKDQVIDQILGDIENILDNNDNIN